MEFFRIIVELNNILAEWDPIGSQLVDIRWPHSEYIHYIPKIIDAYLSGKDLFVFLVDVKLIGNPNEQNIAGTNRAVNQLQSLLSNADKQLLQVIFNN